MNTINVEPAVPAADGTGAWVDTTGMGKRKTVTVTGAFVGSLTIEVGNNSLGGLNWCALHTFTGPGQKSFNVACEAMRCRFGGLISGTPTVDIAANDDGVEATALPVSAGDGVGAGVDVSLYGLFKTFIIAGAWTGVVTIEVSEDNVDYQAVKSITGSYTMFSAEIAARWLRIRRSGGSGGTPVPYVAAVKDDERLANLFGNGEDGDVTLVANITLTRDMYYRTLQTAGWDINLAGFRLFCSELLDLQYAAGPGHSVISANGAAAAAEVAGAAAVGVTVGAGAAGGAGNAGAAGTAGTAVAGQALGGAGGAGGTGNGGANAGGAGGAVTALATATETFPYAIPECFTARTWTGAADAVVRGGAGGGGGGGDAAANEGGGGGGGGGIALVSAKTIRITASGSIQANGGAGAAGTAADCGGGGGGGGGCVVANYRLLINLNVTTGIVAAGGAYGAGVSNGTDGTVGAVGTVVQNQL